MEESSKWENKSQRWCIFTFYQRVSIQYSPLNHMLVKSSKCLSLEWLVIPFFLSLVFISPPLSLSWVSPSLSLSCIFYVHCSFLSLSFLSLCCLLLTLSSLITLPPFLFVSLLSPSSPLSSFSLLSLLPPLFHLSHSSLFVTFQINTTRP